MKRFIFISLLVISFCKAADYKQEAQDALQNGNWQRIYELLREGVLDVNEEVSIGNEKVSLLHFAVTHDNLKAAQELLKKGAKPDEPLAAVSLGYVMGQDNIPFIELLLESGTDPHAKNVHGSSIYDLIIDGAPFINVDTERQQTLVNLFNQYARKNIKPAKKQ